MILLICGSRDWTDRQTIYDEFWKLHEPGNKIRTVIHGAARGADRIGGEVAVQAIGKENVRARPANWDRDKKTAGRVRNLEMLCEAMMLDAMSHGDSGWVVHDKTDAFPWLMVLAFYKGDFSPGTQMMINYARQFGVNVKVVYG